VIQFLTHRTDKVKPLTRIIMAASPLCGELCPRLLARKPAPEPGRPPVRQAHRSVGGVDLDRHAGEPSVSMMAYRGGSNV
jgi:hypothetical protein